MKLDARQAGRALSEASRWRAILLYGEDTGLIRERAAQAVRHVCPALDDPFRVAQLDRDGYDRLEEETASLSLTGGRRVVWVRDAHDTLTGPLERCLECATDTLIVIEAPGLATRSKLRALAEKHQRVASIACYPEEGRALVQTILDVFAQERVTIDREALTWLHGRLMSDRAGVRGEIEKLVLLAGPGGKLDMETVQDSIGDAGSTSIDDAVYAAMAGRVHIADQALERALADGAAPVGVARSALVIINRLWHVTLSMQAKQAQAEAIKALRPPVFFKRMPFFTAALGRWSPAALALAAEKTHMLELACKQTGAPDTLLCRRHVSALCLGGGAWIKR